MADNGYTPEIQRIGVPDRFVEHGKISELYTICGMDAESIAKAILPQPSRHVGTSSPKDNVII
jgi:deoxyxylulose-5-phosphate synthase